MDDSDLDVRLRGKTYVCGVGVQKAGTTWLHDYLDSLPGIYMSQRKELHYFDKHAGGKVSKIESATIRQLRRQLDAIDDSSPIAYSEKLTEAMDILRMHYDEHGYAQYFARRVGENKLFGEITPSYCMIGRDGFAHMKSLFPRVKIVYLLRDPIDRHMSLMRMAEDDRGEPGFALRSFLPSLDRPFPRNMADYRSHIEALQMVFAPDELFIGFYETLFTESEIRRLCSFIGVDFQPASYTTRVNTSNTASDIDPGLVATARRKLDGTYAFCRQTFPELPAGWRV